MGKKRPVRINQCSRGGGLESFFQWESRAALQVQLQSVDFFEAPLHAGTLFYVASRRRDGGRGLLRRAWLQRERAQQQLLGKIAQEASG
jgi:hypothetical protein